MNGYEMKRKIAAMLCMAMLCAGVLPGALAEDSDAGEESDVALLESGVSETGAEAEGSEAVKVTSTQLTKLKATVTAVDDTIVVEIDPKSAASPLLKVRLDDNDAEKVNGANGLKHTFTGVSNGTHKVVVSYTVKNASAYASDPYEVYVNYTAPQAAADPAPVSDPAPVADPEPVSDPVSVADPVPDNSAALLSSANDAALLSSTNDEDSQTETAGNKPIQAQISTTDDSITVTITDSSDLTMYVSVGDLDSLITPNGSVKFGDLSAGNYDIEVDYVDTNNGSNPFRTTVTLSGKSDTTDSGSGSTDGGTTDSGSTDSGTTDSGSGSTDGGTTDSGSGSTDSGTTDSGSAEPSAPAFTLSAVQDNGSIAVTVSGANTYEIELVLSRDGQTLARASTFGDGLVQFDGTYPAGSYTVSAQYVSAPDVAITPVSVTVPDDVTTPTTSPSAEFSVTLTPGSDSLTVTVTGGSGAQMIASLSGEGMADIDREIVDGKAVFEGLAAGEYHVQVDYVQYVEGISAFSGTVSIGETEALPQVMAVDVTNTDATTANGAIAGKISFGGEKDIWAKLRYASETGKNYLSEQEIAVGSDGSFAFTGLAAAQYAIDFYYEGEGAGDPVLSIQYTVSENAPSAVPIQGSATVPGPNSVLIRLTQVTSTEAVKVTLTNVAGGTPIEAQLDAGIVEHTFTSVPAGTYNVSVAYVSSVGVDATSLGQAVVANQPASISITQVVPGENQLIVSGKAEPNTNITFTTLPASSTTVVKTDANGAFAATLVCTAGTYTAVYAQYDTDTASRVTMSGSFVVTAPAQQPTLTVDAVDSSSTTVIAQTTPGIVVNLATSDYGQTVTADSRGILRFSLPHTYAQGTVITFTVYYGTNNAQSFTQTVKVGAPVSYSLLKSGSSGDAVYRLTARLNELGYPVTATRSYTDTVVSAVRLFQNANGLAVDGMAGQLTQSALYSVSAIRYGEGTVYPTLVRGDRGKSLIYTLQQRLKDLGYYTIRVDGIFGSGTQRAVRDFQQVNGLTVTGKADNATQQLLYSSAAKPANGYTSGDYTTLSRSSKYNASVVPLQRRLKALGYYTGSVDGYFGSQTYRAVRNFQSRNGLSVTGVADSYTQQVLYSSSAKAASSSSSSSSSTGYRLLYWGCRGDAVKRLQTALINAGYKTQVRTADGIFGQWTYDGVRAYQKDHGLAVDGIAGKNTQNSLYGTNY